MTLTPEERARKVMEECFPAASNKSLGGGIAQAITKAVAEAVAERDNWHRDCVIEEREACAKVAGNTRVGGMMSGKIFGVVQGIAAAIRARGQS